MARILGAVVSRLLIIGALVAPAHAQDRSGFTTFRSSPASVLEGNWQSCREADGLFGERVYDHYDEHRRPVFELHMGPGHEFAVFRGVQDAHRAHASSANLLWPRFVVGADTEQLGGRTWTALGYRFSVALAGGSFVDCDSWWVVVTRATVESSR